MACRRWTVIPGLVLLIVPTGVSALEAQRTVGPVEVSLYAPDWVWQTQRVNILCVAENTSNQAVAFELRLPLPDPHPFTAKSVAEPTGLLKHAQIEPGATQRLAIVNLEARGDMALGSFPLRLVLACRGVSTTVDYPLATVRGPALPEREWMIWAMAGLAAVWTAVVVVVMGRLGAKGAWRRPSPSVLDEAEAHGN